MIYEIKDCKVMGLYELKGLCDAVKRFKPETKVSPETNIFMLKLLIEELGASLVQKLCRILIDKGQLKWEETDDFEVEAILDFIEEDESGGKKALYMIKWKGWTHEHNTWEPRDNLVGCEDMLEAFHYQFDQYGREGVKRLNQAFYDNKEDTKRLELEEFIAKLLRTQEVTADMILSAYTPSVRSARMKQLRERRLLKAKRKCTIDLSNKRTKQYKVRKIDQKQSLEEWEAILNNVYSHEPYIKVENLVDHEPQPENFAYITQSKAMEGIDVPNDPLVGCECEDCGKNKDNCCAANAGALYAYRANRRLRLPSGLPIYECNSRCKCPPDCPNRVVQRGRKYKLCVFRTSDNRGWGVKTLQRIPKGSFVVEYVGEIITNEEAERRGEKYDAQAMTYLFDLDFNDGDNPFTIDAKQMGNVSHFINHSCDPNLLVFGVWVNHLDVRLPRIALFAKRDIAKGEELTFDYQMTVSQNPDSDVEMESEEDERTSLDSASEAGTSDCQVKSMETTAPIDTSVDGTTKLPQINEVPLTKASENVFESKAPEIVITSEDGLFVKPEAKVDKISVSDISTDTEFNMPMTPAASEHSDAESNNNKEMSPLPSTLSKTVTNKLKSPIKRKGTTAFKCCCGAKNCRKYFFFN